jgi:hypothetical protein
LAVDQIRTRDLRASLSGKGGKNVPEDVKAKLLSIHEENVILKEQLKTNNDKLVKARAVCCFTQCCYVRSDGFDLVHKIARQALS